MNKRQAAKIVKMQTSDFSRWTRLPWGTRLAAWGKTGFKHQQRSFSPFGTVSIILDGRSIPIGRLAAPITIEQYEEFSEYVPYASPCILTTMELDRSILEKMF